MQGASGAEAAALGGLPRTLFACCKLSNLPYDADGAALEQWLVLPAYLPCLFVTGRVKSQAWEG